MFGVLGPQLDERQRRLLAGAQARALGRGGVAVVARTSGMSHSTVHLGIREIDQGPQPPGRIRRQGAGRPKATDRDPGLLQALDALVEPTTRGDPQSPLRWTCKSTRKLAQELVAQATGAGAGPWPGCLARWTTRCRPQASRSRAPSTPTGTASSATSTSRPTSIWPLGSR